MTDAAIGQMWDFGQNPIRAMRLEHIRANQFYVEPHLTLEHR